MNKTELIATVAEKAELSKKDAEKAVNAVFEGITESLKAGDKVALVGFGTFDVKDRAERMAKTPEPAMWLWFPQLVCPVSRQARV